jgi:hypothetical protein
MPPYFAASQEQTKIYITTLTIMTTVEIAKNLRRSKIVPKIPNTKAAGIEIYITNLTKVLSGLLPHPGLSNSDVTLATKIPTISNIIAIFPKRIQLALKTQIRFFIL